MTPKSNIITAGTMFRISYSSTPDFVANDLLALVDIDLEKEFRSQVEMKKAYDLENKELAIAEGDVDPSIWDWDDHCYVDAISELTRRLIESKMARFPITQVHHFNGNFSRTAAPVESVIDAFLKGKQIDSSNLD